MQCGDGIGVLPSMSYAQVIEPSYQPSAGAWD